MARAVNDPDVDPPRRAHRRAGRSPTLRRTWARRRHRARPGGATAGSHDQVQRAPRPAFDDAFDRWRELYRAALTEYQRAAQARRQHHARPSGTGSRPNAAAPTPATSSPCCATTTATAGATDFYSYRYLASEGFLPGYSFPRLPLAAYIPARRGAKVDGDYLQRPRFVAISEFGPGSLIYHEGARYEVTRVQLPRDPGDDHQQRRDHRDRQALRGLRLPPPGRRSAPTPASTAATPLGATQYGLLRLQTVFTRRRERISSDEEERRRSGFELEMSFRFADRGDRPGRTDAPSATASTARRCCELVHADAAEMRIANVGRRRRKDPADRGFWLDLREGTLALGQAGRRHHRRHRRPRRRRRTSSSKEKVTPYVEDRRNILVLRLADAGRRRRSPSPCGPRWSAASRPTFQLEDSELDSRALPDLDDRGRMLLTEAAEGGAGVLSRLVEEPDALARVARRALEIIHYDPDTGDRPRPGARRAGALREGLLRLPAVLRQPVRARAASTGTPSSTCCCS